MLTGVGKFFIIGASQLSATVLPFCFHNGFHLVCDEYQGQRVEMSIYFIILYMLLVFIFHIIWYIFFPFIIQEKEERKDEGEDLREMSKKAIEYI